MSAGVPPIYMRAFDGGDWSHYVLGHDPEELWAVDDPASLNHERLWMRPIPASQVEDYGLSDDECDTVTRDPQTGRFTARLVWIECPESHSDAVAYMGCRYKPGVLA